MTVEEHFSLQITFEIYLIISVEIIFQVQDEATLTQGSMSANSDNFHVPVNVPLDQKQYMQSANPQMPNQLWTLHLFPCFFFTQIILTKWAQPISYFLFLFLVLCALSYEIFLPSTPFCSFLNGEYPLHEVLKFACAT